MAATSISMASFDEALKFKYHPSKLEVMGYRQHPFYAWCRKRYDFGGNGTLGDTDAGMLLPIYHSGGQGVGTSISAAETNQSEAALARFIIQRAKIYSVAKLEREALKASRGDAHAWLEARTALLDERVLELTNKIAKDMYDDGSGTLGVIDTISANVIELTNSSDVVNFEVGMSLVFAAAAPTGALRTPGTTATVTKVDRSAGTVTISATPAGTVADDYILLRSTDYATTGSSSYVNIRGLSGWCPETVGGSDSFFGVNRSVDRTRLAGMFHDGSGQSVEEAIIDAGTDYFIEQGGKSPDVVFCHPSQKADVAKSLQGKAEYMPVTSSDGKVGFKAIVVETGAGPVPLVSDPHCPVDRAFMLRKDSCSLRSLGPTIEMVDEDGLSIRRVSGEDTFKVEFASYLQFVADKPDSIMRIKLAA